jgi:hypothetical protein
MSVRRYRCVGGHSDGRYVTAPDRANHIMVPRLQSRSVMVDPHAAVDPIQPAMDHYTPRCISYGGQDILVLCPNEMKNEQILPYILSSWSPGLRNMLIAGSA